MKVSKRIFICLLSFLVCIGVSGIAVYGDETVTSESHKKDPSSKNTLPFEVECRSAVLLDASSGTVLYAFNESEPLPPASVTKVMTLLLVMEAIEREQLKLGDVLNASEYAASMGGSQIFLEAGEEMTVEDLLKSVIVASANDAAVVLAEAICGSEEAFVMRMNEKAAELGMKTAHFENVTGLDDDTVNHVLSAMDIALCSRELLKHSVILQYSGIWMDSIRDGAFGLTNTNRLIRFYNGATGLKTGSTAKAKFCICATAKREGLHLIAVVMGAPDRDTRNEIAKKLLDWGFANYMLFTAEGGKSEKVPVIGGTKTECIGIQKEISMLLPRGKNTSVKTEIYIKEKITAPIRKGEIIGETRYILDGEIIARQKILASENIEKISFFGNFIKMLSHFLLR